MLIAKIRKLKKKDTHTFPVISPARKFLSLELDTPAAHIAYRCSLVIYRESGRRYHKRLSLSNSAHGEEFEG